MADAWKAIPLMNCGGDRFKRDSYYVLTGGFLAELRQMASLLSCGDKIDADQRRDMGQRIQAVTDASVEVGIELSDH